MGSQRHMMSRASIPASTFSREAAMPLSETWETEVECRARAQVGMRGHHSSHFRDAHTRTTHERERNCNAIPKSIRSGCTAVCLSNRVNGQIRNDLSLETDVVVVCKGTNGLKSRLSCFLNPVGDRRRANRVSASRNSPCCNHSGGTHTNIKAAETLSSARTQLCAS